MSMAVSFTVRDERASKAVQRAIRQEKVTDYNDWHTFFLCSTLH